MSADAHEKARAVSGLRTQPGPIPSSPKTLQPSTTPLFMKLARCATHLRVLALSVQQMDNCKDSLTQPQANHSSLLTT